MKSKLAKKTAAAAMAGILALSGSSTALAYVGEDKGVIQEETQKYSADVAARLAEEGMVLLENERKDAVTGEKSGEAVLPLSGSSTLAVFGTAQNKWTTTSFYDGLDENFIDIMEGIEQSENLTAYGPLVDYYANAQSDGEIDEELLEDAVDNSDAALVVIQRKIGEGSEGTAAPGSYYLTEGEEALIDQVNAAFDQVILVFNTAFTMDMQWVKDKHIDASIWAGNPGNCGGTAVARILTGEVNPSGHLTDTYAQSWDDYPSSSHWADSDGTDEDGNPIVYYTDDIYVGYRYFETFQVPVTYEFGYGLSYTEFEWSDYSLEMDNSGEVTAKVTVENVGQTAGKDVVQLYYSYPESGSVMVDVPSIQLIQYGKTDLLEPGEKQTLELTFDFEDMALFNETSSAYVMYAGAYLIQFAHSVKEIEHTENLNCSFTYNTKNVSHYMTPQEQIQVLEGDENAESLGTVTRRYDASADSSNQSVIGTGEALVEEEYNADKKGYTMTQVLDGEVSLVDFVNDLTLVELTSLGSGAPDASFGKPTLNGEEVSEVNILTEYQVTGRTNGISEREIYNLTMADRQETIGYYNESAWGTNEGSYGFYVFPSNTVNAATWNQELLYEYGVAMGNECQDGGINYFLGISMNIHRNPLGGRNSEYYSEDPVVSGYSGTAAVKGVQSRGVIACIKHFACNNQETNRQQVNEIISERALREIYLKGFQMAVEDGNAMSVMTSYNKVNGSYSPENADLLDGITRGEWGFKGLAMTDWGHTGDMNVSFVSGNDLWMSSIQTFDQFYADVLDGTIPIEYIKLSAARVLQATQWVKGQEITQLEVSDFQGQPAEPTGITLNRTEAVMEKDSQLSLVAEITPEQASGQAVRWSSSDEAVALVDEAGTVTAQGKGLAVITAETENGIKAECKITVKDTVGDAEKAQEAAEKAREEAEKAQEAAEKAREEVLEAQKQAEQKYALAKENLEKLEARARAAAAAAQQKAEEAQEAEKAAWEAKSAAQKLVQENAGIKLKKSKYTVKKGKKVKIKATSLSGKKVAYKAANKKIARVSTKGVVKGLRKGKTTITLKCGSAVKKVKVTVK